MEGTRGPSPTPSPTAGLVLDGGTGSEQSSDYAGSYDYASEEPAASDSDALSDGSSIQHEQQEQQQQKQGNDDVFIQQSPWIPDHSFKVLLIGDSGVGKTCLVMRYLSDRFEEHLPSTVGVDFAIKRMYLHGLNIKVSIWDTAGQERFRALTSTFYRGAKGIIFVYDVTRQETLASLSDSWMAELEAYQPHPDVARMVVANKVDQHGARQVSWQEGADFAKQHGCLFVETSAKQNIAVGVAFEELVLRILDTPSLLQAADEEQEGSSAAVKLDNQAQQGGYAVSCSC